MNICHNGTMSDIITQTQAAWIQRGKERWQYTDLWADKKTAALPLLQELGCVHPIYPQHTYYDYVLMIGGYAPRGGKIRPQFLLQLWKQGLRFGQIILLTSDRPLDPSENLPLKTEAEMIASTFAQIPELTATLVSAPMLPQGRPSSIDAARKWLSDYNPKPGSVLVISNQPFTLLHDASMRSILPSTFSIETVGPAADPDLMLSVYLDNLARYLYQQTYEHR